MADNMIEDSDHYTEKDDVQWGYEEGKKCSGREIPELHSFSYLEPENFLP